MTYDKRLDLPAGVVVVTNTTGKPERVLTPQEWAEVEELPPWRP